MDEARLAELLKDVVADTPPPTFTHADVTATSARESRRHRNGVMAGSAFGVAVLAGATALGVALWTGPGVVHEATSAENSASSGNGNAAPNELPDEDARAAAPTERGESGDFPSETPKQGGYPTGNGGPSGSASTPSECEQVARELAAALAGELPAAADVKIEDAVPVSFECPLGARGAAFDLPDGRLSVVVLSSPAAMNTSDSPGAVEVVALTDAGQRVVVVSEPSDPDGAAPFVDELDDYAATVARLY